MSEFDLIKDAIKALDDKYLLNGKDIVADYNRELEIRDDYRGRQVYELLQNVDDCNQGHDFASVRFELVSDGISNLLIVKNTGEPFSAEGIESLMTANVSTKSKRGATIGNKGLGFRSVLNWSEKIKIVTKEFVVSFSEDQAISKLIDYRSRTQRHSDKLYEINRVAILTSAEVCIPDEKTLQWLGDYDTAILLYCGNEPIKDIRTQLESLEFNELLFLKHLRKIEIVLPDFYRAVESEKLSVAEDGCSHIRIKDTNKNDLIESEWYVWNKSGELTVRDDKPELYEISLAYNTDDKAREKISENGYLYSFFRTDIKMPFPFLIHATFNLTSSRNDLKKSDKCNELIVGELASFMVETSVKISEMENVYDYTALKCLIPKDKFFYSTIVTQYKLTDKINERIKDLRIFPSINDEYLSLSDGPMYSDTSISNNAGRYAHMHFADFLNKSTFRLLLKNCDDSYICDFLSKNNVCMFSLKDIVKLIDIDADEYVKNKSHVYIIMLLHACYGEYLSVVPHLMVDNKGDRIIDNNVTIYNNPTKPIENLPDWAEIRFMDKFVEDNFKGYYGPAVGDVIKHLSDFGCSEYSFSSVFSSLTRQSKGSADRTIELLRWLYRYWTDNAREIPGNAVDATVVTRDGKIVNAKDCYLGVEYGFETEERITKHISNVSYLASNDILKLKVDGNQESDYISNQLMDFLSFIGLSAFPKISIRELNGIKGRDYLEYNSKKYTELSTEFGETYYWTYIRDSRNLSVSISDIYCIDDILADADYYDILYWLLKDEKFNSLIIKDNESYWKCKIECIPYKAQNIKTIRHRYMRSWLRRKVTTVPWLIAKSGKKVNFSNCTVVNHELSPIEEVFHVDYSILDKLLGFPSKRQVEALMESLGMAHDYSDLPKEEIYRILNGLPTLGFDIQNSIERGIIERVYSTINQAFRTSSGDHSVDSLIKNNSEYNKFAVSGKVLTRKGDEYAFVPVNEAYYVDKNIYGKEILKNYQIFYSLSHRSGNDKVHALFCVQSFKNITGIKIVDSSEHRLNSEYGRDEYTKQLPYIYLVRMKNTRNSSIDLRILRDSVVILEKNAVLAYSDETIQHYAELNDFESAIIGKNAYIKIPDYIDDLPSLRAEPKYLSSMADIITTFLDVDADAGTYSMIFSLSPSKNREYYKLQGDESLLEKAIESFGNLSDAKDEFWNTLARVTGVDQSILCQQFGSLLPDDFNYKTINDRSNFSYIAKLFTALKIDISDYNKEAPELIHFEKYNQDRFSQYKALFRDNFLYLKLSELIHTGGKTLADFAVIKQDFDSYLYTANSVYFDPDEVFEKKFNISTKKLNDVPGDYSGLLKELKNNEVRVHSIEIKSISPQEPKIEFNHIEVYNDITKMDIPLDNPRFTGSRANTAPGEVSRSGRKTGNTYSQKINVVKDNVGYVAECAVFTCLENHVKTKEIAEVYWKSGNAEKAGNPSVVACDDSLGYDIEYYDNSGAVHYVEVKGNSSGRSEFTLSENEYLKSQETHENYEVWLVIIKDGVPQNIHRYEGLFDYGEGQDFRHNDKFSVMENGYKIALKQ